MRRNKTMELIMINFKTKEPTIKHQMDVKAHHENIQFGDYIIKFVLLEIGEYSNLEWWMEVHHRDRIQIVLPNRLFSIKGVEDWLFCLQYSWTI